MSWRVGLGIAVSALALGVAGCASSSGVRFIGAPSAPPSVTAEPARSSAAPSSTAPDGLTAADGIDVAACADGTCEIVVQATVDVPLDRRFGFVTFRVTFVPPNTVEFFGGDPERGNLRGSIGGSGELQANGIVVAVRTVRGEGAVLRFSPRG